MKRKLNRRQILRLIQNRKDGHTNLEISKRLGVHYKTIDYWFKRLRDEGYDIPPRVAKGGRKRLHL